jgi:hypothetical protein
MSITGKENVSAALKRLQRKKARDWKNRSAGKNGFTTGIP